MDFEPGISSPCFKASVSQRQQSPSLPVCSGSGRHRVDAQPSSVQTGHFTARGLSLHRSECRQPAVLGVSQFVPSLYKVMIEVFSSSQRCQPYTRHPPTRSTATTRLSSDAAHGRPALPGPFLAFPSVQDAKGSPGQRAGPACGRSAVGPPRSGVRSTAESPPHSPSHVLVPPSGPVPVSFSHAFRPSGLCVRVLTAQRP